MKPWIVFFIGVMAIAVMAGKISAQEKTATTSDTSKTAVADTLRQKMRDPTGAMLRSMIVPGWGQWYNGKRFKAFLVFGAEAGLIANTIYQNQKVQSSSTELEREFYLENRRLSNWWLAGVILYSMIDAYVDAHLSDFDESPDLGAARAPSTAQYNELWGEVAPIWLWRVQFAL